MEKKIFITGAAGFIGYHLTKKLFERGDRVTGFDNFNDYYDTKLKRDRAKLLSAEIIEGDICNFKFLIECINKFKPTHIVHLAAQAGVRYSIENPRAYLETNIDGFFNILEVCRLNPEIKLIYASSSSVYGDNEKTPFSIEDRTDSMASFYGMTKKNNEMMASIYHKIYGISVTGLRFFTVYGEWGRPDMAYFSFANKIVRKEPIQVYNYGNLSRDFTYIDDIIEGIIASIDLGGENEIFNLGNNKPESLTHFIDILEKNLGIKVTRVPVEMQKGDVLTTFADISYSAKKLHYKPKTSLEEGLAKFVSWFKNYYFC